jgi:hypothetical protein
MKTGAEPMRLDMNILDSSPDSKSWKAEFRTGTDPKFYDNAIRLATRQEAEDYGADLHRRWTLVVEHHSVESSDPVSHTFHDGTLSRVAPVAS